jgi:hypothetical protein
VTPRPLDAIERAVADALASTLPGVIDQLAEIGGPRAYSVHEVAVRLDLSDQQVYRLIHAGHLLPVPHLSPQRIADSALKAFLAGEQLPRPAFSAEAQKEAS